MSKQYGLILPGQQKKSTPVQREVTKPSIFDESSSSDEAGDEPPQMLMKKAPMGPSVMERRRARNLQDKALAEDPTVFQYDELYDEMENKREEEKQVKKSEPKKPKYITKLLETAERRKLENELRVERQVQKEREEEGEEFKDKEAFVTSSYRQKLEEMRKLEEQNKRDDYLEAIGDVTKQQDLDGFYRHLYEQKMGTAKEVKKPELLPAFATDEGNDQSISYKPIKSGKSSQQRGYRKRQSSDEDEVDVKKEDIAQTDTNEKKQHLTNNIDADSDFSIDDSSSESNSSEDENDGKIKPPSAKKVKATEGLNNETVPAGSFDPKLNKLKKEDEPESENLTNNDFKLPLPKVEDEVNEPLPPQKPKRDKAEIWKKRTVGEVFEAAVQRYYARKAARNQA